jgi:hypothetical protein
MQDNLIIISKIAIQLFKRAHNLVEKGSMTILKRMIGKGKNNCFHAGFRHALLSAKADVK